MGHDPPPAVQGGDGKTHPTAPFPHFPGKEPRTWQVYPLHDFFNDGGLPAAGGTCQENVFLYDFMAQFSGSIQTVPLKVFRERCLG
jgi:hypothetical protein